jgi:hypothetical protein
MKHRGFCLILGAGLALFLALPSHGSTKQDPSIAKEYQRIKKAFETAQQDYFKAAEKAKTEAEKEKVKYPDQRDYSQQMLALAEKDPKNPASVEPLVWAVQHAYYDKDIGPKALAAIKENHITSDKLDQVCRQLVYGNNPDDNQSFLKELLEKNPNNEVKGAASLALGQIVGRRNPEQAEKYFNDVIDKYGTKDQKDSAKGELFEMHNLAIGKVAPDIEGQDVDGKKFKLSDYRGKVVVLDFWGDW